MALNRANHNEAVLPAAAWADQLLAEPGMQKATLLPQPHLHAPSTVVHHRQILRWTKTACFSKT